MRTIAVFPFQSSGKMEFLKNISDADCILYSVQKPVVLQSLSDLYPLFCEYEQLYITRAGRSRQSDKFLEPNMFCFLFVMFCCREKNVSLISDNVRYQQRDSYHFTPWRWFSDVFAKRLAALIVSIVPICIKLI